MMREAMMVSAAVLLLVGCGPKSDQKPAPVAAAAPPAATVQPAAAPKCVGPEWRQLDFWVGDWVAEWPDPEGKGHGRNRITRNEYGDCVIYERFTADDGTLRGMSVSSYRPGMKKWRQVWVDDQGGFFNLTGGPVTGQPHIFELVNERPTERAPPLRMIWQDVTPDHFVWRWQTQKPGSTEWVDQWRINYRRATPADAPAKP